MPGGVAAAPVDPPSQPLPSLKSVCPHTLVPDICLFINLSIYLPIHLSTHKHTHTHKHTNTHTHTHTQAVRRRSDAGGVQVSSRILPLSTSAPLHVQRQAEKVRLSPSPPPPSLSYVHTHTHTHTHTHMPTAIGVAGELCAYTSSLRPHTLVA